jgi:adenosylmethionine---8-amino-7-oxononanoate aminotransferase
MKHQDLVEKDHRYLWHPFTQMDEWVADNDPVIVRSAKGAYLTDTRGRKLLDGVSSLWCNVHGHRVKEIDRAIRTQMGKVAHTTMLGASSEPAILLAEKLVSLAPKGLKRVFYSDSGSEANEIALKMAFQYWRQQPKPDTKRDRFLTVKEGYHGDTLGAVSQGGIDLFHGIYGPLLFKNEQAPSPHGFRRGRPFKSKAWLRESLAPVERLLRSKHRRIAAVHLEPLVEGAGGMLMHPDGYLRGLRRLCDRHGLLLILDEVATGFGRTGTMFACDREGVTPDILCLAKNLTGGYLPLAATLATEKVYRAFLGTFGSLRTFYHGHTFTGNQLACAAALANLSRVARIGFMKGVRKRSQLLQRHLAPLKRHPHVSDIRLRGLMGGIELVRDKKTNETYPYDMKMGYRVCAAARRRGVLLRPLGNVVVLMPPLAIPLADLRLLARVIRESIQEATGTPVHLASI